MPSYFHTNYVNITHVTPQRASGKKIIESKIGNSQESPLYLRTAQGLISRDTYKNPFLEPTVNDPTAKISACLKNKQTFNIFSKMREDQKNDVFLMKEVSTQPTYK